MAATIHRVRCRAASGSSSCSSAKPAGCSAVARTSLLGQWLYTRTLVAKSLGILNTISVFSMCFMIFQNMVWMFLGLKMNFFGFNMVKLDIFRSVFFISFLYQPPGPQRGNPKFPNQANGKGSTDADGIGEGTPKFKEVPARLMPGWSLRGTCWFRSWMFKNSWCLGFAQENQHLEQHQTNPITKPWKWSQYGLSSLASWALRVPIEVPRLPPGFERHSTVLTEFTLWTFMKICENRRHIRTCEFGALGK